MGKRKFQKEIIEEAMKRYKDGIATGEILDWVEEQTGTRPSYSIFTKWRQEQNIPKRKRAGTSEELENQYVKTETEKKLEAIKNMKKQLKVRKQNHEQIIQDTLAKIGYHDANLNYEVLLEYFKLGRLIEAQVLITSTALQRKADIELLDIYGIDNPTLLEQLNSGNDSYRKMVKLYHVLKQVTGKDNGKTYYENYISILNKEHSQITRTNDYQNSRYGELLEAGVVIFPNQIKLKNRYVNFLLRTGETARAEEILTSMIKSTDIGRLAAEDRDAYIKARSTWTELEKRKQAQKGTGSYKKAKKIASGTLAIAPGDLDAQLHLAHISLLEGKYQEAERRVELMQGQIELAKEGTYSTSEKKTVDFMERAVIKSKIAQYGLPEVIRQEDEKYKQPIEEEIENESLLEIQQLIYKNQLEQAQEELLNLPRNYANRTSTQYVRMQYYLAAQKHQMVKQIYQGMEHKEGTPLDKAMAGLLKLNNSMEELQKETTADER